MKNMKISALALCSLAAWSSGSFNPVQASTEGDSLDVLPDQADEWSDAEAGAPLVTIETVSSEWENAIALDPIALDPVASDPLTSNQNVIEWSSDLESPAFINTVVSPADPLETNLEVNLETTAPREISTETPTATETPRATEAIATDSLDSISSPKSTETIGSGYLPMEPLVANIPDSHLLSPASLDAPIAPEPAPESEADTTPIELSVAVSPLSPQDPSAAQVVEDLSSSLNDEESVEESVEESLAQAVSEPSEPSGSALYASLPDASLSNTPESNLLAANIVASSIPSLGISGTRFNLAQLPLEPPILEAVNEAEVEQLINEIDQIDAETSTPYRSSPAITISNPSGFGADNFTGFVGIGYQERTRFANEDDGGLVVGMGFGDARENVGVQLSYTVASFGGSRDFGTGGFNAKLHRRLSDEWSVAVGWEGFATTGFVDFEDSIYGSASHLIRTRDSITKPFSRIALTAGAGSGRFRTEEAVFDDRDDIGVFGTMSVRVVEPVSAIVEWTGQDLAAGLSITPFKKVPLVLLPAVRDITGAGDGARFVMGAGFSFQL